MTALDEERVRIVAIGQEHAADGEALRPEARCEFQRGSLATAVGVCIEGEINRAWAVAQLLQLAGIQMCAQRASDVAKATLRAVKESMGEGGSDTAAVEIQDTPALATREDHAPIEGIAFLCIEQAE